MNFISSLLPTIWLTRAGFFLITLFAVFIALYIIKIIFIKEGKKILSFLSSICKSIKQAVIENPEIKKFTKKHKTSFDFLQKRLDKNNFYGLPLTLLFLALLYALSLFGGVAEDIINSDLIVAVDTRVANLLAIFRNDGLTKFFFWITLLGEWRVVWIFIIAVILILWILKKRTYIIPLLLCIAGSAVFTSIGKLIFHRARPSGAIYPESSFSFPSGHATLAVAFYGFLAYIIIRNVKRWNKKINVFFASFILIVLIGFSRLYLDVHYLSDVWGGYLMGAIWLIIAISFSEYFLCKKPKDKLYQKTKRWLVVSGIIIASIILYIIIALNYQIPASTSPQKINQITINDAMTIFNTTQLKYTETLLGNTQEPLSFIIIAKNDQQLVDLFKQSGWVMADDVNMSNVFKLARAALLKKSYSKAPMTPDFWDAKVHDFGFEKSTESNNVRSRHHARFWKTNYITENGDMLYVGTASFDNGIKWGVAHQINPDIDTEREFLFNDLQKTGMITDVQKQQFVDPKLGKNFSGDMFFTDGKLYLISIKK